MPCPKATWRAPARADVRSCPDRRSAPGPVGGGHHDEDLSWAGMSAPPMVTGSVSSGRWRAARARRSGGTPPRPEGRATDRIAAGRAGRMAQQATRAVADGFTVVSWPATIRASRSTDLGLVRTAPAGLDWQRRQQVVAGGGPLCRRSGRQVAVQSSSAAAALRGSLPGAVGLAKIVSTSPAGGPVGDRLPKQLEDHGDGKRQGRTAHQIDRRAGPTWAGLLELVEQLVDDVLNPGRRNGAFGRGERWFHRPAGAAGCGRRRRRPACGATAVGQPAGEGPGAAPGPGPRSLASRRSRRA